MKKWGIGFVLTLLACLPIFLRRSANPSLLVDTDTAFLLKTIREVQNPWQWFVGDWPLYNHFYRPISTLVFEFDNWRYGDNPAGYGLTNAFLAIACVLLLFWMLREVTDSPPMATGGAVLFALWHVSMPLPIDRICLVAGVLATGFGIWRHGKNWRAYLPAVALLWYLPTEVYGMTILYQRMIAWIPGRTASVMAVFCLIAMAAYARYERTGAMRSAQSEAGPLDPPATRNTKTTERNPRDWVWLVVAVIATALALGSYEQAVMLPAALFGLAVLFRWQGGLPHWWTHALFWGVLALYFYLRWRFLPAQTSGYQEQQLRYGPGVWLDLFRYLMPQGPSFWTLRTTLEVGPLILLIAIPWMILFAFVSNVWSYAAAVKSRVSNDFRFAFTGWFLSFLSFLPMAWLNHFAHYEYWPMAMRTMLVVILVKVAADAWATAASPPTRQAPPRQIPSPGSLPHR